VKFFRQKGESDLRYKRLDLRKKDYEDTIVPEVYRNVTKGYGRNSKDWERAHETVRSLAAIYKDLFGKDLAAVSEQHKNGSSISGAFEAPSIALRFYRRHVVKV
jgi:hypothetical protein